MNIIKKESYIIFQVFFYLLIFLMLFIGYCGYIPHVYPGNLFGKTYGTVTSIAGMKSRDTGIYLNPTLIINDFNRKKW